MKRQLVTAVSVVANIERFGKLKFVTVNKVDDAVLARIKKALALGNHAGTGEEEARAAIRSGHQLIDGYSSHI